MSLQEAGRRFTLFSKRQFLFNFFFVLFDLFPLMKSLRAAKIQHEKGPNLRRRMTRARIRPEAEA